MGVAATRRISNNRAGVCMGGNGVEVVARNAPSITCPNASCGIAMGLCNLSGVRLAAGLAN